MAPLRLNGSTSGYSQIDAPAVAGDQTFTLPGTGGTLDRLNRAGNVLQVVNATYATADTTSSSSTYADTGLTATITPTSSSSKVLVFVALAGCYKSAANTALQARLLRGETTLLNIESSGGYTATAAANGHGTVASTYLDSPATTSATSYKVQFRSSANIASVGINTTLASTSPTSTITLMEIAA